METVFCCISVRRLGVFTQTHVVRTLEKVQDVWLAESSSETRISHLETIYSVLDIVRLQKLQIKNVQTFAKILMKNEKNVANIQYIV